MDPQMEKNMTTVTGIYENRSVTKKNLNHFVSKGLKSTFKSTSTKGIDYFNKALTKKQINNMK
jgi:hypothetical protein